MNADSELFQRISQGSEESFTEAFDQHYAPLCFYADKFIHDMDESRSLVQEVFVDLWTKRSKIHIKQSLKSYLFKSVRNISLDYIKHKNVESKYLKHSQHESESDDRDLIEEAELNACINRAVEELPEKCREIFLLCRFEDLTYKEIADRLNLSIKTIEMQMSIALKKLRLKLTDRQHIQLLVFLISKK